MGIIEDANHVIRPPLNAEVNHAADALLLVPPAMRKAMLYSCLGLEGEELETAVTTILARVRVLEAFKRYDAAGEASA